jgi:hypothetical protein
MLERSDYPHPDRARFIPWSEDAATAAFREGPWTSWGVADLASAMNIDFGRSLR